MNRESFFIAIDGDSVGRKIEKLIISNNLDELVEYSRSVDSAVNSIRVIANHFGGETYLQGGDNLLIEVQNYRVFVEKFIAMRSGLTTSFSMGIGKSVVESYLALKFAKSAGRGLIILADVTHGKFEYKNITENNNDASE